MKRKQGIFYSGKFPVMKTVSSQAKEEERTKCGRSSQSALKWRIQKLHLYVQFMEK